MLLTQAPDQSQQPFGLGGIGGLGGLSGLGMGSANFMEMQQRMQREVRMFSSLPFSTVYLFKLYNLQITYI